MVWLAVILGGALSLLPVVRLWRAGLAAKAAATSAAVTAALSVVIASYYAPVAEGRADDRPVEVLAEGHVGSATCRSCHPGEHASWYGSFHRTMTQPASRETVLPQFERLELDWYGEPAVLEWRGERLWTKFVRGGGSPGPVERPIVQLTGSHHMQVFWYSTGAGREVAPISLSREPFLPITMAFWESRST